MSRRVVSPTMKYRRIDGALHNFGHSFLGGMNYVLHERMDKRIEFVYEIVERTLRELPEPRMIIRFPEGTIEPPYEYPDYLRTSIAHYGQQLADHLTAEGVTPESVKDVHLVIWGDNVGLGCKVRAQDDRGGRHDVEVRLQAG